MTSREMVQDAATRNQRRYRLQKNKRKLFRAMTKKRLNLKHYCLQTFGLLIAVQGVTFISLILQSLLQIQALNHRKQKSHL